MTIATCVCVCVISNVQTTRISGPLSFCNIYIIYCMYIMQYIHAAAVLHAAMILLPARTITVLS